MPVVISSDLVLGSVPDALPLDHPRLMWRDVVPRGVLTASSEAEGFDVENIADGFTWDFWRAASLPGWVEVLLDEAEWVDYCLVAAHSLGTVGAAAQLQYWDGSDWVPLTEEFAPGDDRVLAFLFPPVLTNRLRLVVNGDGAPPSVGVLMVGPATAVERKIFRGHVPAPLARRTVIRPNVSENGQWLGRSVRRKGIALNIAVSNLTSAWVRAELEPFIEYASGRGPFGWAWRPGDYPDEVAYCWTDDPDIHPVNTGPKDLMSVAFSVKGMVE